MPDQEQLDAANRPLDKRLMRYIWRHTKAEQIWILCVILASMPTYFMVLNLPVRIVNEPTAAIHPWERQCCKESFQ